MENKNELKKLGKSELLDLVEQYTDYSETQKLKIEELQKSLEEAEQKIQDQITSKAEPGTLADSALQMSGIFAAADKAAESYKANIAKLDSQKTEMISKTKEQLEQILSDARGKAQSITDSANKESEITLANAKNQSEELLKKANDIVINARHQADEIVSQAKIEADNIINRAGEDARKVFNEAAITKPEVKVISIENIVEGANQAADAGEAEYAEMKDFIGEKLGAAEQADKALEEAINRIDQL